MKTTRSMTVYVAGPIRYHAEFNHPAFAKAAAALRERGFRVISPHEMDIENGLDVTGLTGYETLADQGFNIRATLAADLHVVAYEVDAVILLEGWETSKGALAEYATARAVGIPTWELEYERDESGQENVILTQVNYGLMPAGRH